MLRIRLVDPLPPALSVGEEFSLSLRLTNESGSCVFLREPAVLRLCVVGAESLEPVASVTISAGCGPRSHKLTRSCETPSDLLGRCDTKVAVKAEGAAKLPLRLSIELVLRRPLAVSPSADPLIWPAILLPDGMTMDAIESQLPALVTTTAASAPFDKKAEKKRRAAAFAASSEGGYDVDAAAQGPASTGVLSCVPILSTSFSLLTPDTPAPHVTPSGGFSDAQFQIIPVFGRNVRILERTGLVGPGFGSVVWGM